MENNNKPLHMGEEIFKRFQDSGMKPEQFADRIGCARGNVYNIFKRPSINADQLVLISKALNHNFLLDLAHMVDSTASLSHEKSENEEKVSERMALLPERGQKTVSVDDFAEIVKEFLLTNHKKPLLVLAYDSQEQVRKIVKDLCVENFGRGGYKETTELDDVRFTSHEVFVVFQKSLTANGAKAETILDQLIGVNQKVNKHIIYIVDVPKYHLKSIDSYNELERFLHTTHRKWEDNTHAVCFDATGELLKRQQQVEVDAHQFSFDESIASRFCALLDEEQNKLAESGMGVLYSEDGKRLLRAGITDRVFNVADGTEVICNGAFKGNSDIQKVLVPPSVQCIGNEAFADCANLLQAKLADGVTSIGKSCFAGCSKLVKVELPDTLKYISAYAFEGCSSLKEISIPVGKWQIGEYAFARTGLESIELDGREDGLCKVKEGAFCECESLAEATISDNVAFTSSQLFNGCKNLRTLTLSGKKDGAGELISAVTGQCPSLSEIVYKLY